MSDFSFPEPRQWNGDEPDPGLREDDPRCPECGCEPGPRGCACDDYEDPHDD